MLGWHISIYRQARCRNMPPSADAGQSDRVAVWQAGLNGIDWIRTLVRAGRACFHGGNGYPYQFAGPACDLIPTIIAGPPLANNPWICDPSDILGPKWVGHTLIDHEVAQECAPDEWLIIEIWDES